MTTETTTFGPEAPYQPALFPDSEITGTGRPAPWPLPEIVPLDPAPAADPDQDALPFDDEDGAS